MRRHIIPLLSAGVLILSVSTPLRPWITPVHAVGLPPAASHSHRPVCGLPGLHTASCDADVATDAAGAPLVAPNVVSGSYAAVQFHTAYSLPCTPGGPVQSVCPQPASFGPTVAIVDAYNDPTVESDLGVYDQQWGLPDCTQANGCLTVVDQTGGINLPATVDGNWGLETSLDVQTVHEICQTCRILLLEAASNNWSDMAAAVSTAAGLGVVAISNSYGGS
jgi:hypothetical protein